MPLVSSDRLSLIKDQKWLKNHWAERFSNLLNRLSTVDPDVLQQIPQQPVLDALDLPLSAEEIKQGFSQMNSNKATGKDGIPAEICKALNPKTLQIFQDILEDIWFTEEILDSMMPFWNKCLSLYKNKGSTSGCRNYRDISPLSIADKILPHTHSQKRKEPLREWFSARMEYSSHEASPGEVWQVEQAFTLSSLTRQRHLSLYSGGCLDCPIMDAGRNLWSWFSCSVVEWRIGSSLLWYIICICHFQWCEAGLCARPLQSFLHLHLVMCWPGSERGSVHQVPTGQLSFWPSPLEHMRCLHVVIQETLFADNCMLLACKDSDV